MCSDQPEIWKAIPGFEGQYEVSDQGRVRSLDRIVECFGPQKGHYSKRLPGKILKDQNHSGGYRQVGLSGKLYLVPWLVLAAFRGPRPPGLEACHNDGNKKHNSLWNLRWDTHVENCADRIEHGTHPVGERNKAAVLTSDEVKEIRAAKKETRQSLSLMYGVSKKHIDRIRRKDRWAHV